MVLVGATIVGSMATVWHGVVNPPRTREPREWRYDRENIVLAKGAEMGRFLLGSTVILLFPQQRADFTPDWAPAGRCAWARPWQRDRDRGRAVALPACKPYFLPRNTRMGVASRGSRV
jgi:hypothetical protein